MKVAVFGAKGFLGRHLCNYLESTDNEVIEYSSKTGKTFDEETGLFQPGFSIENNTDCVVYLSQSPRYRHLPEQVQHLWNVNVTSAIDAARLAANAGVRRFIYASTGNVFKPSFDPLSETSETRRDEWYPLSKLHAEEALSLFQSDIEIISIRLFAPYGPGQTNRLIPNLINKIKCRKPVIIQPMYDNDNDNNGLIISLCYVEDVIKIITRLVQQGGPSCLSIASNESKSVREIACIIGENIGIEPVFKKSSTCRQGNLIADISRLEELMHPDFTPFNIGIRSVLDSKIADKA